MEPRNLDYVVSACAGTLVTGPKNAVTTRVCTDSRLVGPGDLFVALAGERFDGHRFLDDAARKGAVAVMLERDRVPATRPACAVIAVDNTRRALGRLAARYREEFSLPVVVIGGSNGKTTTKELVASVLRQKLAVLWSEASFNNDIGVPLTLLRLEKSHAVAVLEAGTNHPGELEPLLQMIRPRFGVLTNIGREHLEFFGDIAGVVAEEARLGACLPADGKFFVNGDDDRAERIARQSPAAGVRVGTREGNDWRATNVRMDKTGTAFTVETVHRDFGGEYRMRLWGRHQVVNALFAMAVGMVFGLSRAEIQRGLAECQPPRMRLQLWELNGVTVLDDAYNANADSVQAALQTLLDLPCKGRRVAVLGDMAELGSYTEAAHEEVGRRTAELGVGQLFVVGKMASVTARAARAAGLNRVLEFADVDAAAEAVRSFLKAGDLMLLKASRSARFERFGEWLRSGGATKKN